MAAELPADRRRRRAGPAAPEKTSSPPGEGGDASASQIITDYTRWLVLIGLITAAVMEVLDTTIINVSLPQMMGNLSATPDEIGWVATGYILTNVIVLPMTAWLSQRFGRKNYLTFSIALFIGASFFCGTSRSLVELVFWRIVQGAGGAALLSTAQATLRQIFPKEQQAMVQTLFLIGVIMAPTLGPTIGGYITDNYTWPWVFFVNIPIGLISMAMVVGFLHDPPGQRKAGAIDWPGIGLLAVGLGSLQYVLEEGKRDDWFDSVAIVRLSLLAAVCLIALLVWELSPRNKAPVVDFRILKNRDLSAGLALFLALGFGLYGGIFIFPLFVQSILQFTPTETGLVLLPGGIATGFAAIFCGRMLNGNKPLVDARVLIFIGMGIFIVSMWMLGHLTTQSGEPDTRLALIIRGAGLGFLFAPINFVVFAALKGPEIAQGSGLINLARQLGGSFGIAVLNTYITNQTALHRYELVSHLNVGNAGFTQRQDALMHAFTANGYGADAARQASLGAINQVVQAQALTMSYNDAFLLLMLAFFVTAPAVFFLGRANRGATVGAGH